MYLRPQPIRNGRRGFTCAIAGSWIHDQQGLPQSALLALLGVPEEAERYMEEWSMSMNGSQEHSEGVGGAGIFVAVLQRLLDRSNATEAGTVEACVLGVRPNNLRAVMWGVLDVPWTPTVLGARTADEHKVALDVDAWLLWVEAGLALFSRPLLAADEGMDRLTESQASQLGIRTVVGQARRVMVALAMLRHSGNLTHAAKDLGTSRRALREQLKTAGLYPWSDVLAAPGHQRSRRPSEARAGSSTSSTNDHDSSRQSLQSQESNEARARDADDQDPHSI